MPRKINEWPWEIYAGIGSFIRNGSTLTAPNSELFSIFHRCSMIKFMGSFVGLYVGAIRSPD